MADGDRATLAGWVVREDWRLGWNQGHTDPEFRIAVCGEIGHVRWLLQLAAFRELARQDLRKALVAFAEQVGVEYTPRQSVGSSAATTDHNGGNP